MGLGSGLGLGLGFEPLIGVTIILGRERRMEVVSLLSSMTRGITRKIRSAQKEASVRT